MCTYGSIDVLHNTTVLWDENIHSHSELAAINIIPDDCVAKFEINLRTFKVRQDGNPWNWEVKQSHIQAAERFLLDKYGTPEKLMYRVSRLNPLKFERWSDLFTLLTDEVREKLPKCRRPCPRWCRYRRRCPYRYRCPCRYLTKTQQLKWGRAWKKKWIELYSNPKNRL